MYLCVLITGSKANTNLIIEKVGAVGVDEDSWRDRLKYSVGKYYCTFDGGPYNMDGIQSSSVLSKVFTNISNIDGYAFREAK